MDIFIRKTFKTVVNSVLWILVLISCGTTTSHPDDIMCMHKEMQVVILIERVVLRCSGIISSRCLFLARVFVIIYPLY
jgi:hypothetical protein